MILICTSTPIIMLAFHVNVYLVSHGDRNVFGVVGKVGLLRIT